MTTENKATAKPTESFTGNIEYFTLYSKVDMTSTGDYADKSQRIFDTIISLISMRAQPIVIASPYVVSDLNAEGAGSLTGAGYVFKFIVEHAGVFASVDEEYEIDDDVYHLKYMFDDIDVEDVTFVSGETGTNIEFAFNQNL